MSSDRKPREMFTTRIVSILALVLLGLPDCIIAFATQEVPKNAVGDGVSGDSKKGDRKIQIRFFGRITDQDGKPLVASKVQVITPISLANLQTLTDSNGQYELDLDSEMGDLFRILIRVETEDRSLMNYVSPIIDSNSVRAGLGPLNVTLYPSCEVEIEVFNENGFAVEDGMVCLFQNPNVALGAFVTRKEGRVRVAVPKTVEPWTIVAFKKEVGFASMKLLFANPGGIKGPVSVVLEKAQPMRVQLIDLENNPIVGARVVTVGYGNQELGAQVSFARLFDLISEETDDSGEAWLDAFPFGVVTLACLHPDYETYTTNVDHKKGPEYVHQLALRNVVNNRCLVVDEFGKPLIDKNIDVEVSSLPVYENQIPNRTDENGMIAFSVVVGKPYMLTARRGGQGAAAITGFGVTEQESDEVPTLRLMPLKTITGTLRVDGDGKAVANRTIYLSQLGASLNEVKGMRGAESIAVWVRPSLYQQCITDEEGRFQFLVPQGEFNISLSPTENASARFWVSEVGVINFDLTVRESP
jgi:hypothetical protein